MNQYGKSYKTVWFHINHLMNFWSSCEIWRSLISLAMCYFSGSDRWILRGTKKIHFYILWYPLENVLLCNSEADVPSLDEPSCKWVLYGYNVSMLFLFSRGTLVSFLGVFINQVFLKSIFSGCTTFLDALHKINRIWGHCASLINVNMENSLSNTIWCWGKTWPVSGLRIRDNDTVWNGY